jgi:hypothetical protein
MSAAAILKRLYGHSLIDLYKAYDTHHLIMSPECPNMIGILVEHFNEAKWHITFRYAPDFRELFPALPAVSVFSHVLLETVQPVCGRHRPARPRTLVKVHRT